MWCNRFKVTQQDIAHCKAVQVCIAWHKASRKWCRTSIATSSTPTSASSSTSSEAAISLPAHCMAWSSSLTSQIEGSPTPRHRCAIIPTSTSTWRTKRGMGFRKKGAWNLFIYLLTCHRTGQWLLVCLRICNEQVYFSTPCQLLE